MAMSSASDEITRLLFAYAERLDLGDFAGVAGLFEHATYRSSAGGHHVRAAGVHAVLERLVKLYDGIPRTKHVITNVMIDVDSDERAATGRSYFTVYQATEKLPLQAVICGRYYDRFERVDGTWRFSDRLINVDLVGDLRCHLEVGAGF
jgi:3-phenylpropionate/cinnamic acid dioxygenase small subunit